MLNKEALEAALVAHAQAETETFITGRPFVEAIIKAYIAALPDEGEIVAILRQRCSDIGAIMDRDGTVDPRIDKNLMKRAADALETARAKVAAAPEVSR